MIAAVLAVGILGAALKLVSAIRGNARAGATGLAAAARRPLPFLATPGLAGAAALIGAAFTGAGLNDADLAGLDSAGVDLAEMESLDVDLPGVAFSGDALAGGALRTMPPAAPFAGVAGSEVTVSVGFRGAAPASDFTCGSAPGVDDGIGVPRLASIIALARGIDHFTSSVRLRSVYAALHKYLLHELCQY